MHLINYITQCFSEQAGKQFVFRASLITGQAQHRAIFEAVESRDAERAAAVAREHARLTRQNARLALASDTSSHKDIPGLSLISS